MKLAVVSLPVDKFRDAVKVDDRGDRRGVRAEEGRLPHSREAQDPYTLVDVQAIRERRRSRRRTSSASYDDNQQQYSTPEQVRASHILLKTQGKDEAAVKKLAEDLAAKAKAGADFAELAKKIPKTTPTTPRAAISTPSGADRWWRTSTRSPFAMKPGKISDPVKTQFGYHVIKLTEKRPRRQRPLAEVRGQIEDQIRWQRAQDGGRSGPPSWPRS